VGQEHEGNDQGEAGKMNFYPHHIGDYMTATAHLTWLEDVSYRRLLDLYYSREQAIPADVSQAARLVRAVSKEERKAVETVLREFFEETPEGWKHSRCEEEISKAKEAAERARANGKKGGRPPKEKPTDNPEKTQPVISGNPEESKSKAPNTNTNTKEEPHTPQAGLPSRAVALQTYLDECKAKDCKPIPEDDAVFEYAMQVGIPHDFLRLQWLEFKDRYTQPGAKRYKAWPVVFGKSVRANWFRLWYATPRGDYALTTEGQQAKRLHKGAA
jgi:uncharacterized protein YdaU (DUF1376 family)